MRAGNPFLVGLPHLAGLQEGSRVQGGVGGPQADQGPFLAHLLPMGTGPAACLCPARGGYGRVTSATQEVQQQLRPRHREIRSGTQAASAGAQGALGGS